MIEYEYNPTFILNRVEELYKNNSNLQITKTYNKGTCMESRKSFTPDKNKLKEYAVSFYSRDDIETNPDTYIHDAMKKMWNEMEEL